MTKGFDDLAEQLQQLKQQNLYRKRRIVSEVSGAELKIDGQQVINFSSNDYLGLATAPELIAAFQQAAGQTVGSGSAHLICGHSQSHHALEQELAEFTGRDRALLFSTGYMANLGLISALLGRGDQVFQDRLNHASLLDGGLLSGARFKRYRHNDTADLQAKIKKHDGRTLIATDGVFSMDGDLAALPELSKLATSNNAWLMVDDAHGLGVLGGNGGGVLQHYGLTQQQVPVLMGTLGKALGTSGAFIAGSEELIETLIQKARSYIYTTAMPPAIAEATRCSLKLIQIESWRRDKLQDLIQQFRHAAKQFGLPMMTSETAIQPILIGGSQRALDCSETLLKKGFLVPAIRPPTVPKGEARLRITLSAAHQPQQIEQLLEVLDKFFNDKNS